MDRNLDEAQFVLMVCTETYRRRVMGREEPGKGLGVRWEGSLIYNRIYNDKPSGSQFIPILLLPGSEPAHIPNPVQGHSRYALATFDLSDPQYKSLYRHLTGQPATREPDLGPIQILPPEPRPQPSPGPLPPSGGPTVTPVQVEEVLIRPRIFISYSHRDKRWLEDFRSHIQPLIRGGHIDPWDDRQIAPGQEWHKEITKAIEAADIAVLLVSPDFLNSEFIANEELPRLLAGRKTVFWIAIRHSNYAETPIAKYQCANATDSPLASLSKSNRDKAWVGISKKLLTAAPSTIDGIASGAPWWNIPFPRNPNFTGRESILTQLETALASSPPAAMTQAIAGLGGVGKTQTAVEYAYRHRDRYRAVLWVRANTETDLVSGYRELAEVMGLPERDESDSNKAAAAVRRWLGREPGYLLILDNAADPALVKPYLPPEPKGHILLTSRQQNFDALGIHKPIKLPVLLPDEAWRFS